MIAGRTSVAAILGALASCAGDPAAPPKVAAGPARDSVVATRAFETATQLAKDDPRGALVALDKAILADPEHVLARLSAVELRLSLGEELERAARDLAPALKLAPDNSRAHLLAGQLAQQLGDAPRAGEHLSRAAKLKPDWDEPHFELADVWARLGRTDDAIAAGTRARQLSPDRLEVTMRLVDLLAGAGRPADAARELETAATRIGRSAPLFRKAAQLFEEAALPVDATRLRRIADTIDPPPVAKRTRELPPARKR